MGEAPTEPTAITVLLLGKVPENISQLNSFGFKNVIDFFYLCDLSHSPSSLPMKVRSISPAPIYEVGT